LYLLVIISLVVSTTSTAVVCKDYCWNDLLHVKWDIIQCKHCSLPQCWELTAIFRALHTWSELVSTCLHTGSQPGKDVARNFWLWWFQTLCIFQHGWSTEIQQLWRCTRYLRTLSSDLWKPPVILVAGRGIQTNGPPGKLCPFATRLSTTL